jgi:hypothetical protein
MSTGTCIRAADDRMLHPMVAPLGVGGEPTTPMVQDSEITASVLREVGGPARVSDNLVFLGPARCDAVHVHECGRILQHGPPLGRSERMLGFGLAVKPHHPDERRLLGSQTPLDAVVLDVSPQPGNTRHERAWTSFR